MADSRRILILTADTGFGHRSAANAIAAALEETYGGQCLVEIVNPLDDRRVLPALRRSQADYDRVVRETPEFYRLSQRASEGRIPTAVTESALTVLLFEAMRETVRRKEPDAIVSTHPFYAHPLAALFAVERRRVPLLVAVTDLQTVHRVWFHKSVDLCLVPTAVASDLALDAGLAAEQVRVTGIPVHPKFAAEKRTPAEVRLAMDLHPDRATVLAVGSRRTRKSIGPLRAINHSGLPIQLIVVTGGDRELHQQLQQSDWHIPIRLYDFVENMAPLMRAADAVLCKAGGLIVSESLACGLPLLLVDVLPGQEDGNASYVIEGGAGDRGADPLEVLEILFHWLKDGGTLLAERAENAARLGRPRAAYEVADLAYLAAGRTAPWVPARRLPGREGILDLLRRHGVRWKEGVEIQARSRRSLVDTPDEGNRPRPRGSRRGSRART